MPEKHQHSRDEHNRFSVAFSFPGEYREYVRQVDQALQTFLPPEQVFIDERFEAEVAGFDAETSLQTIYHDQSELIVVFLCKEYVEKTWCCNVEWRAIRDLIKRRRRPTILPLRLDRSEIPGIYSIDICPYIGDRSPAKTAQLIYDRLLILRGQFPNNYIKAVPRTDLGHDFVSHMWRWTIQRIAYLSPFRRRYLTAYRERLRLEFRYLDAIGRSTPMELQSVYVAQRIKMHKRPELMPDFYPKEGEKRDDETARLEPTQDIETTMGRFPRIVLLGDPGVGKTTLLRSLALRVLQKESVLTDAILKYGQSVRSKATVLPVFVTLNDLARTSYTLFEGMADSIAERGCFPAKLVLARNLRLGRCLCLFDGLDEVTDENQHDRIVREINNLTKSFKGNMIIVSSRSAGFGYGLGSSFSITELTEFIGSQIKTFINNWFEAKPQSAEGLLSALHSSQRIQGLAANPLLLTIIAVVYELDTRLPERRVELYERCVWVLTEEWDRIKSLPSGRRFAPDMLRRALRVLALRLQVEGLRLVSKAWLIAHLQHFMGNEQSGMLLYDEILERTGLIRRMSWNSYAFTHLTFQEYLAAQAIYESGEDDMASNRVGEAWWEEVIVLLAGIHRDATDLVRTILEKHGNDDKALILTARCLVDADLTDQSLRRDVLVRLIAWLDETEDIRLIDGVVDLADALDEPMWEHLTGLLRNVRPQVRIRAIRIMSAITALRAVPCLVRTAAEDLDDHVRRAAAFALRSMGEESTMPLVNIMRDREYLYRCRAAEALGWVANDLASASLVTAGADLSETREMRQIAGRALGNVMVSVPAGEFIMGCNEQPDERPLRNVHVDAFLINRYPVTNAQYEQFVLETGHAPPHHWGGMSCPDGLETHPVVNVTWFDAQHFADWCGRRLPTECEWEKAARGTDGRIYPWGTDFDARRCNTHAAGEGRTTAVGRFGGGESPYGAVDMVGNVWEWTADSYTTPTVYSHASYDKANKVIRGGSFQAVKDIVRCSYRNVHDANVIGDTVGFRCVSSVETVEQSPNET